MTNTDIEELKNEISKTKKNKATNQHLGLLKKKLSKLIKDEQKIVKSKSGDSYFVKKTGHCQCSLIGFPSVGKSSFISLITNAKSSIGAYDFTTIRPIVGTFDQRGMLFQVIDLPGILLGASKDRGKGRRVISAARTSDILLIFTDVQKLLKTKEIFEELYDSGIRINESRPNILFEETQRGGLECFSLSEDLDEEEIKEIFRSQGKINGSIIVGRGTTIQGIIDWFNPRTYMKGFLVINKGDLVKTEEEKKRIHEIAKSFGVSYFIISIKDRKSIDDVLKMIERISELLRVFMLPKKTISVKEDDLQDPVIVPIGTTIKDLGNKFLRGRDCSGAFLRRPNDKKAPRKVSVSYEVQMDDCVTVF